MDRSKAQRTACAPAGKSAVTLAAAWLGMCAALAVPACDEDDRVATPTRVPEPPRDHPTEAFEVRMADHFAMGMVARDALVRGDEDGAREALAAIARLDPHPYPIAWEEPVEQFRSVARRAARAHSRLELGLAIGQLALGCASCHRSVGASVPLEEQHPPAGEERAAHMRRHQWATDQMWEGLMAPDDAWFMAGASALVEAPLAPHAFADRPALGPEVARLAAKVHHLGENAKRADSSRERVQLFAELLTTCADCHENLAEPPSGF